MEGFDVETSSVNTEVLKVNKKCLLNRCIKPGLNLLEGGLKPQIVRVR